MQPCPGNWVAIRRAVVYYAQPAHTFSAGIKCGHCSFEDFVNICCPRLSSFLSSLFPVRFKSFTSTFITCDAYMIFNPYAAGG